jgi:hypothetical protein
VKSKWSRTSTWVAAALTVIGLAGAAPNASAVIPAARVIDGPSADLREVGGVAMAADGTGGLVYRKLVAGRSHIFASRFTDGQWSEAQRVDVGANQQFDSTWPTIAAGDDGRLVVVWVQEFGASDRMYSAALQPGSERFEDPVPVDLAVGDAALGTYPQASMSAGGQAFVVYRVVTDPVAATAPPGNVFAEYRVARFGGQYWSGIGTTLNRNPASASPKPTAVNRPRIGIDQAGNAVAAWQELDDDFIPRIYARRIFGAGVGLARQVSPSKIDGKPVSGSADRFDLAVGRNGEAAIAWRQNPSAKSGFTRQRLFASLSADMYSPQAATFGAPTPVDGGGSDGPREGIGGLSVAVAGPMASVTFGVGSNGTRVVHAYDGASDPVDSLDEGTGLIAAPAPLGLLTSDGAEAWLWNRTTSDRSSLTLVERRIDGERLVRSLYTASPGAIDGTSISGSGIGDALVGFGQGSGPRRRIAAGWVDAPPGAVNVQTPVDAVRGKIVPLAWDRSRHAIGGVSYSVEVDGELAASGLKATSLNLSTAGLSSGRHRVSVTVTDSAGQSATGPTGSFRIDRAAPAARIATAGRTVTVKLVDAPSRVGSGLDPASVVVSLGDGSSIRGRGSITHRYSRPGSYRLSITASDLLGNSLSSVRSVRVR